MVYLPKRKTIEEVKERIYELSDGKVELLSDEYINSKQKLKLKCECGSIFERDFGHINKGRILCLNCMNDKVSEKNRLTIDEIKNKIHEHGCEYIDGEYKNYDSKLKIKCSCGNIFDKSLHKFLSGQDHCQECGRKKLIQLRTKYTPENSREILLSYGYNMIGDFINAATPVKCLCKNNHECNIVLSQLLCGKSGCQKCAILNHSGINHHNYQGGVSLLEDVIRQSLNDWKSLIRHTYLNKCPITGYCGEDLVVHHLVALSKIFNDATTDLNIDIENKRVKLNEFDDTDEYRLLLDRIIESHNLYTGILISKDVHVSFHKQYGYGNNTPGQFNDFLINNYSITLDEIQSKYINAIY